MGDKIILKDIKLECNLGVTQEEKQDTQPISIDLEISVDISKASQTDNIEDTINYSEIQKQIKQVVENNEFNLIEKLANDVAIQLLKENTIKKVKINVKKLKMRFRKESQSLKI